MTPDEIKHRLLTRGPTHSFVVELADELAASRARVDRLTAALKNIHQNVKGLSEGVSPNIGKDAVWYFKVIRGVAEAALDGAATAASQGAASQSEDEYRQPCPNGCLGQLGEGTSGQPVPMYCGQHGCDVESPGMAYKSD